MAASSTGVHIPFPTALPQLQTARLSVRKLRLDDANAIFAYASDAEITRFTLWDAHSSVQDSRRFVDSALKGYDSGRSAEFAVEHLHDGVLIGTCGFSEIWPQHGRAEIAFVLSRKYWGKGYMAEAVHSVLEMGFSRLRLHRVFGRVDIENNATVRLLKRAGFTFEGVLRQDVRMRGSHRDVKVYSILRHEFH